MTLFFTGFISFLVSFVVMDIFISQATVYDRILFVGVVSALLGIAEIIYTIKGVK